MESIEECSGGDTTGDGVVRRGLRSAVRGLVSLARPLRGTGISRWPGIKHAIRALSTTLAPANGVARIHGHQVELHRDDAGATTQFVLEGRFEEAETEFLRQQLSPGMTALDVGANIGIHTLTMCAAVGETGKVFAFEPAPANIALLSRNIERNGYDARATVVRQAVSDVAGPIEFALHESSHGQHHIASQAESRGGLVVDSTTIDDFISAEQAWPDVIKIDVEGAELRVLRGMRELLASNRPLTILAEYWPPNSERAASDSQEFPRILQQCGFRCQTLSVYMTGRQNVAWIRP